MMDLNIVVIAGVLAAPPEHRTFESGTGLWRLLVTTRITDPKRCDVIPVIYWDTDDADHAVELDSLDRGDRVFITGTVQRRFWSDTRGRRTSGLELIVSHIQATEATATHAIEAIVPAV